MAINRPPRTLGSIDTPFWDYCTKEELRLQKCAHCNHINWPAVAHCEVCKSADLTWEKMTGQGKLISWCTFDQDYYRGILPIPWDTIVVELDEGPLFISNPEGFSNQSAKFGEPVTVKFIDCEDENGQFKLPVFAQI